MTTADDADRAGDDSHDPPAPESAEAEEEPFADVPDWDDEYLQRVSRRLMYNYDLERDHRVRGERFDMFGLLHVESQKQILHPALNWANYEAEEYLYARRVDRLSVADLERVVDLGHDVADERIEADEEHYRTDITFVSVVPEIPADVAEFVSGFSERTMLKYGYYGQYEINLAVVAPEQEQVVGSENADVGDAFALWRDLSADSPGLLQRLLGRLRS